MKKVILLSRIDGTYLVEAIEKIRQSNCQLVFIVTALGYNYALNEKNYQLLGERVHRIYSEVRDAPPTLIITGISQLIPLIEVHDPDLIVCMYFPYQLTKSILNHRSIKINCHPSPLPLFRGSNIFGMAIRHQISQWGVTWHYINEEYDQGSILLQDLFHLNLPYGIVDILDSSRQSMVKTLPQALEMAFQGHPGIPQRQIKSEEEKYLYAHPFTVEERTIKRDSKSDEILLLVQACQFFHPALLQIDQQLYHVIEAQHLQPPLIHSLSIGEIKRISTRFIHQCLDGQIEYSVRAI